MLGAPPGPAQLFIDSRYLPSTVPQGPSREAGSCMGGELTLACRRKADIQPCAHCRRTEGAVGLSETEVELQGAVNLISRASSRAALVADPCRILIIVVALESPARRRHQDPDLVTSHGIRAVEEKKLTVPGWSDRFDLA